MHLLKNLADFVLCALGPWNSVDVEGKTHVFSGGPGPKVSIRLKDQETLPDLVSPP